MLEWIYVLWLRLKRVFEDRTFGAARSSDWPTVRRDFLKTHPTCEACGRDKYLQVHHKSSFATDPSQELNPQNLIVLCEGMESNCHRLIGHLQNYKSLNETVVTDAAYWLKKIQNRPSWDGAKWAYPTP